MLNQFDNPVNPKVHRDTTAGRYCGTPVELWTPLWPASAPAATITGVGEALKEVNRIPWWWPWNRRHRPCCKADCRNHGIPGLGPDFVPPILNLDIIDEIIGRSG